MDCRRRRADPPPTPPPNSNPNSSLLQDVTNLQTPRRPQNPNPSPGPNSIFFTASKNTPFSTPRRPSISHSTASRRLKSLKIEQSRSARKIVICKEKTLKSFSKSITSWLNFLFENPKACGCEVKDRNTGEWRGVKRKRNSVVLAEKEKAVVVGTKRLLSLQLSLKDVCSFEDMRERMQGYISSKGCQEVFLMMSQVCKNIDEGRLKMKAHCPIVTDLAVKEKATRVLMSYNPMWLRVGLHIVFGGDSLLDEGGKSGQDDLFIKMIIDNQFFTHTDIARSYAYNKLVEGLYRPGYFETLGNILLKRFLLMVISLDKAKCESTLPLEYGIDGMDGGSPLLFIHNSHIKSSRQVIQELLLDAMHGEGDLLAHLTILGCKVNYQQLSLAEYKFKVTNLFEDLQDGIMLCRAIQLLKSDPSILSRVTNPSDTRKKLQNCNTALQYLKQANIPLSDEDGVMTIAEDIVNGDKELSLSILWNMFIYLQVPLLIDKISLVKEIVKIKGSDVDPTNYEKDNELGLLLTWIQAVCERQNINICSFSSVIEGNVFTCLIDYYCGNEENQNESDEDFMRHFGADAAPVHKIALVQSLIASLGNFPEVFQLCDMVDQHSCYDERSVIILLVFLASNIINKSNLDQLRQRVTQANGKIANVKSLANLQSPFARISVSSNKKMREKNVLKFVSPQKKDALDECMNQDTIKKISLIQLRWSALRKRKSYVQTKLAACVIQRAIRQYLLKRSICEERAASVIQSFFRGYTERKKFMKIKMSVSLLQAAVRTWLTVTSICKSNSLASSIQASNGLCNGYLKFMTERHRFLRMKKAVLLIQHAVRIWVQRRHHRLYTAPIEIVNHSDSVPVLSAAESIVDDHQTARSVHVDLLFVQELQTSPKLQDSEHLCKAATRIQIAWKRSLKCNLHMHKKLAAIQIQRYWCGWYLRKNFICQVAAVVKIQAGIRCLINQNTLTRYRLAAIEIQRVAMGNLVRRRLLGASNFRSDQLHCASYNLICNSMIKNRELKIVMHSIVTLQRWWKKFLLIKSRTASVILIQSSIRGWSARREANRRKQYISIIQRRWRNILVIKSWKKSAPVIQAHVRGWIVRREVERVKQNIVIIQSFWKGYLARKASRQQIVDLRCRLQKSSANVDDDKRLINRLLSALSELLIGCRSIRNIRHTCATFDMATEHSEKCCETLVAAGAVDILLKQFHWLNRGIPDQEILKHVISTLRNIARYPHLLQVLIDTPQAVEIIFQELLRNKGEGFFIVCQLLKKVCTMPEGLKAVRRSHCYVRRLNNLVNDLERKTELQRRNARLCSGTDITTKRRLREAVDLMLLIKKDHL